MAARYTILVCAVINYAGAHPFPPLETAKPELSDSSLGLLLENLKDFNSTNLFASFRLPPCVQECVDDLANSAKSLDFDSEWSLEKTKLLCGQFGLMKSCLNKKPMCNSIIVEIGMHTLEYLCTEDETIGGILPCIRRESLKIHGTCERACKLGATLMDAASLNTKNPDSLNFLDEHGNKVLSVPDLHVLCNTSTCFLSCMKTGVDEKCPHGGTTLIDNILSILMKRITLNQNLPETKVLDAYASLVSSVLPRQCQHLILQDRDIILTTPSEPFTFITSPHATTVSTKPGAALIGDTVDKGSEVGVQTRNEDLPAGKSGDNESTSIVASVGASNTGVFSVIFSTVFIAVNLEF